MAAEMMTCRERHLHVVYPSVSPGALQEPESPIATETGRNPEQDLATTIGLNIRYQQGGSWMHVTGTHRTRPAGLPALRWPGQSPPV